MAFKSYDQHDNQQILKNIKNDMLKYQQEVSTRSSIKD